MTKQNYKSIAWIIKQNYEGGLSTDAVRVVLRVMVDMLGLDFAIDNRDFNREQFVKDCGV